MIVIGNRCGGHQPMSYTLANFMIINKFWLLSSSWSLPPGSEEKWFFTTRVRWRTPWPTSGKWSGSKAAWSLSCSQGDDHHDNDYDYDDINDDFDDNVKAGCQRTATSWLTGTGRRRALSNTISLRWGLQWWWWEWRWWWWQCWWLQWYWPEEGSEQYHIFEVVHSSAYVWGVFT